MKEFIKVILDAIKIKRRVRKANRQIWLYKTLSKSKWGNLYILCKLNQQAKDAQYK